MSIHRGLAALTAALSLLASCASGDSGKAGAGSASAQDPAAPGSAAQALASASGGPSAGGAQGVFEMARCGDRLAKSKAEPALPGAPDFEANRVELAGRPRGTSLLWTRVPAVDPKAPASAAAALAKLERTDKPLTIVKGLLRRYGKSPEVLRSVVLREGYVYAADPGVALALVESLRLTHLFREDAVFLLRGKTVHALRRAAKTRYLPERYLHEDGALKGSVAELLLGDRVSLDREHLTTSPAALDLASASADEGFDRMRVTHLSASGLVAEVRYPGGVWVTALFDIDGAGLRLACVDGADEAVAARAKRLEASAGVRRALAKLRATVSAQVQEEPPFDEPKDEPDGEQQDGTLRREWRRAYIQGQRRFTVGQVTYDIYDEAGRAVPPQVCVDFITDTWERASGTWYRPLQVDAQDERGRPFPERVIGGIDFDALDLKNRRSVAELVAFARRHPEMFDVLDLSAEERIPFTRRSELFAFLSRRADDFAPGDVLVIHGVKSDGHPHYHSVMIVEQDPITGVPSLVAGNAGRPREQTLEGVMARSPKRAIKHRIRPRPEWLVASILGAGEKGQR